MARKLTPEERARRYAAKLEALCAKPQWFKRGSRFLRTDAYLLNGDPESTPNRRWHRGEDGPLGKWSGEESDEGAGD